MNLEQAFIATLVQVNNNRIDDKSLCQLAISLIDLTLLDDHVTGQALALLHEKACQYHVAAICVYPDALSAIKPVGTIKRATVVNFPHALTPLKKTLQDIEQIISQHSPDEIDYVFPRKNYLDGAHSASLTHCQQAQALCKKNDISFKVILETGAFSTAESIYQLSRELIDIGCDFLKSSTGKIPTGATPLAAFSMLQAIKDSGSSCGIKFSGGIKEPEQAFLYMHLARHMLQRSLDKTWFRIGASSLLDNLLKYQA